jgi:5-methylthioribose kinase
MAAPHVPAAWPWRHRRLVLSRVLDITAGNVRGYLVEHEVITSTCRPEIRELGGGISNVVIRVEADDDCFVLKQSLPKLRVADDWPFDRRRIFRERDCMLLLSEILVPGSVPTVRFHDDENFVFTMSCAPEGGVLWKEALMAGDISFPVSEQAGRLLAHIHNLSSRDTRVTTKFSDQSTFIEGRVDPYHWTAAASHPDLAAIIRTETDRLLATRLVLVHGDFSPKNIIVYGDREGHPRLFLLDFEVAHLGDPAFDVAFCLTHLVLKAIRFPERAQQYIRAAGAFWEGYMSKLSPALDPEIEPATTCELGCLLLARIDGKSKIEYITKEPMRNVTRRLAREILLGPVCTVDSVLALAAERLALSGGA